MQATQHTPVHPDEPIGIVISRGSRAEDPPIFSAFVWGPAPEDEQPPVRTPRAA